MCLSLCARMPVCLYRLTLYLLDWAREPKTGNSGSYLVHFIYNQPTDQWTRYSVRWRLSGRGALVRSVAPAGFSSLLRHKNWFTIIRVLFRPHHSSLWSVISILHGFVLSK